MCMLVVYWVMLRVNCVFRVCCVCFTGMLEVCKVILPLGSLASLDTPLDHLYNFIFLLYLY